MKHFVDNLTLDGAELRGQHLHVNARVARAGNIQLYRSDEVGIDTPDGVVRVYRPEEEVFNTDSIATYAHKLVTLDHPAGPADFKQDGAGWIGDEVMREGDFVRVPMVVASRAAVDAIRAGKRELSMGYAARIDATPGKTPKGEAYDAIMRGIAIDHVAIVDRARGGADLRIDGDAKPWGLQALDHRPDEGHPPQKMEGHMADQLTSVVLGDAAVSVDAASAATINAFKDAQAKALTDAKASHDKALGERDAKIADLESKLKDAEAAKLTDAQIAEKVKARADLLADARKVFADFDAADLSDADIRRKVVADKHGDDMVKDRSDDYVQALFDGLVKAAAPDPVRDSARGSTGPVTDSWAFLDAEKKEVA